MAQEYACEPKDTAADQATGRLLSAEVLNNHLLTARQAQGDPNAGTGYELDAIAAAVLGGASLFGARGSILGTFLGVLLVQILTNGLNLLNFDPQVARIVEGALLIAFVYIDHWRKRRLATA